MTTPDQHLHMILGVVSQKFGVPTSNLMSRRRFDGIVLPRHAFCYVARKWHSSVKVGRFLGRDHAAILNGARRCAELMTEREKYGQRVREIVMMIEGLSTR